MDELLIPFGYDKNTGAIVEPEDAARGRACNCICPGCCAPLVSRHSEVKRSHFAHDSKNKTENPSDDCPFSSAVAIAMMARNLVDEYAEKSLSTPGHSVMYSYECCGKTDEIVVSSGAINTIDSAESNVSLAGQHVDLKFVIAGYQIYVDLVYAGKHPVSVPSEVLQENKAGLLRLYCSSFSTSDFSANRDMRFSDAVLNFVLVDGFKDWVFHPRESSCLNNARSGHRCRKSSELAYTSSKKLQCVRCGLAWEKAFSQPFVCPECNATHLYQRER
ncbi:hypothetical protein [Porticoccus sp.]